jgi:purine-binding chemotaxis protein CheW
MSQTRQYSTFYLDKLLFGVESLKIQEVMRFLELTAVPLAPAAVSGLMNLRGQIVIALDLRHRLRLAARPEGVAPMCVVVRGDDGAVSLLVDDIGDVVEVEDATFEPPPETLRRELRSVIVGVHKLERQLMHVLDADRVCEIADLMEREPAG